MGEANEAAETETTSKTAAEIEAEQITFNKAAEDQAGHDIEAHATFTADTDQNGTEKPLPESPDSDPVATELAGVAGDEIAHLVPSIPPEAEALLKAWLRTNIMWVQNEMEHAKLGTSAEDRAILNP